MVCFTANHRRADITTEDALNKAKEYVDSIEPIGPRTESAMSGVEPERPRAESSVAAFSGSFFNQSNNPKASNEAELVDEESYQSGGNTLG